MDPPINIGFSDHVMNICPGPQVPQFPAAAAGYHHVTHGPGNMLQNVPVPTGAFGPSPRGVFGPTPDNAFGSAPHGVYGPTPADAFGPTPHGVYGPAPADVFGYAPPNVFGPAPTAIFDHTPYCGFGPAPADSFGTTTHRVFGPDPADVFDPAPHHVFGPTPADAFGSAPYGVAGPAPAYFGSTSLSAFSSAPADAFSSAPHGAFGPSPADGLRPTAAVFGPASLEFDSLRTPAAAAAPYGFITNNWLEERQSWFPRPPTPSLRSEDKDEDVPAPLITGGFRIGFENYEDDATVHYHNIAGGERRSLVRSHTLSAPSWPVKRGDTRRSSLHDAHDGAPLSHVTTTDWRIALQEAQLRRDPEVAAFCDAVQRIRREYCASDRSSNPGRIWSVAVNYPDGVRDSEVEIAIVRDNSDTTLHTVQRDSVCVEVLVAEVLRQIAEPARPMLTPPPRLYPILDFSPHDPHSALGQRPYPTLQRMPEEEAKPVVSACYLSVCGLDEYLQPGHSLRGHTALQRRGSIRLRLHVGDARPPLARTAEDDGTDLRLGDGLENAEYWHQLRKRIFGAVSHYEDKVGYFLHDQSSGISLVLDAVKDICYLLRSVETQEISDAVRNLSESVPPPMNWTQSPKIAGPVLLALVDLSRGVSRLLSIYSRSFHTDFMAEVNLMTGRPEQRSAFLTFRLYAAHNLPEKWTKSDGVFYVSCSVIYAGRKICPEVMSSKVVASESFFFRAVWDEMISFPVAVSSLPYESLLVLRLCAVTDTTPRGSFIAWSCRPLYYNQQMVEGELLLNMISHAEPPPVITPGAVDVSLPTLITVQVDFLDSGRVFQRPRTEETSHDGGAENLEQLLQYLAHRSSLLLLSEADKQHLWSSRHCTHRPPSILPLILGSAPGWDPPSVSAMYCVLDDWTFSSPLEALGLLSPCFADKKIRGAACRQLERLTNDEILMFLPQLVQAVKFEWCLDSVLVQLLLHRALQSIQVAHRLYWLLSDAASAEPHYCGLYRRLLDGVERCVGRSLNLQLCRQKRLLKILGDVAEKVKNCPEDTRQDVLRLGLQDVEKFFEEVGDCRLPLNPAIVVKGIVHDSCSFFKSNTKPLKISFINADHEGPNVHVMYKIGDDMRQDALILQLVEIMDRIWLHEGLDMRMVTYKCVSTGRKQGLVELVPDSTTLAKIQKKSGLLGPLKDSSMKKWFRNNKTASDNFLCSCAGWCVVTFLLGVCDRHNDNIMLTGSGHMFHIDFGKILGNAQMFGKIKRDRAPFIFTTEMESFITQQGKHPQRAQEFVELCCCAYNVIRRHSHLIVTLLEMMLQAGLPELRSVEDLKYVHDKLRPYDSDAEAANYFTSKIKESLESPSVKLNFLLHAFAHITASDLSQMSEVTTSSLAKFIRRAAVKSVQKVHRAGGRILGELGVLGDTGPPGSGDCSRCVQLHVLFSSPRLCILLKHLRNIYMPDGSAPTASVTITLYTGTWEIASQRIQSQSQTCAPVFNQRVEFSVPQLDGYILRILVRSQGTFLGQLSIPLIHLRLQEDVWYQLSA